MDSINELDGTVDVQKRFGDGEPETGGAKFAQGAKRIFRILGDELHRFAGGKAATVDREPVHGAAMARTVNPLDGV